MLEGGADLGGFGEMRGRVDVLSLTLTHKLLMSSFLGQVTAADSNCHFGEEFLSKKLEENDCKCVPDKWVSGHIGRGELH